MATYTIKRSSGSSRTCFEALIAHNGKRKMDVETNNNIVTQIPAKVVSFVG